MVVTRALYARGLLCCLLLLAGCERPGEGAQAAAGYAARAPVIGALARFNAENRVCPAALADLVPTYLNGVPGEVGGYPLDYRSADRSTSYELTFSYSGPGMKGCRYRPDSGWACNGYY